MAPFTTAFQTAVAACVTDIVHEGSARVPLAEGGCLPVERNLFITLSQLSPEAGYSASKGSVEKVDP